MSDVTVIVVTYDRPAWCEIALRSAIATGADVLLFDNGSSTDYAERLASEYGVDYRRNPVNVIGAPPFEYAHTTYAALLYDDDALMARWLPLSLAKAEEGCDVVAASFWLTDEELRPTYARTLQPATLSYLLSGQCPVNDGALVRMSLLDGVTWHPERKTVMFYSLWLELAAKGARFGVTDEPCWYYRQHAGQMSRSAPESDARWRAEAIAEWRAVAV